jgi:hypothetical protein
MQADPRDLGSALSPGRHTRMVQTRIVRVTPISYRSNRPGIKGMEVGATA